MFLMFSFSEVFTAKGASAEYWSPNRAKSSTVTFLNPVTQITVPTKHLDQL